MIWDELKNIVGNDTCKKLRPYLVQIGIVDAVDRQLIIDRVRVLVRDEVRHALAKAMKQGQK
jgi:hypothetical protein